MYRFTFNFPSVAHADTSNTMNSQDVDVDVWRCKRTHTIRSFAIVAACLGMEASMTITTLWEYIQSMFPGTKDPFVIYSVIAAAYYMSGIPTSLVVSRLADRYRRTRLVFIVCSLFAVVGNIIYSLNFSIALPIIGRLVSGVVSCLRPVMTGEIARSCESKADSTSAFMSNGAGWIVGFFIGPVINICFSSINVRVGEWHLTNANFIGLFMALVYLAVIALTLFGVHDLSREHDPKAEAAMRRTRIVDETTPLMFAVASSEISQRRSASATDDDAPTEATSPVQITRALLTSTDTITLIACSMMARFVVALLESWVSLICVELLHWSTTGINAIMFCAAVPSCIALFALTRWPPSQRTSTIIALAGMLAMGVDMGINMRFQLYPTASLFANGACWAVWVTLFFLFDFEEVFLTSTMAQLMPSHIQSFAESQRQVFVNIGGLFALLCAGPAFQHLLITCSVVIVLLIICTLSLAIQYKVFVEPAIKNI